MSRRTNYIVGLLLILATLAILFAVGFVALPQISGESETVFTNPAQAQSSDETAVTSTDSDDNRDADDAFIALPTKVSIAAPTAVIEDTGSSVLALDTSESIGNEQPMDEAAVAIEAVVVEEVGVEDSAEVAPQPVDNPISIEGTAGEETWLFSVQNEEQGWLGIFFKAGAPVTIYGRSEDGNWLHVEHEVAVQGWVYANAIAPGQVDIASLPISTYVGSSSQAIVEQVVAPTAIIQQVAAVQSQATVTLEPTWTPVPTVTPTPTGPWATKPPAHNPWVATNTPFPTWTPRASGNNNASQPIATPFPTSTQWPTRTPWPTATAGSVAPTARPQSTAFPTVRPQSTAIPTVRPQPTSNATERPLPTAAPTRAPIVPTNTPVPQPSVQAIAPSNEPVPTQDAEIAETNAIAWWHSDVESLQANGGKWRFDIIVRVPTSFKYGFEMERLVRTVLSDQNSDGDDYFTLSVSGIDCGSNYSDVLIVRQNGARMNVVNEYNLNEGAIVIRPPC